MTAALLLIGAVSGLQSAAEPVLSLSEAVRLSIGHSTTIRSMEAELRAANARVGQQAARGNLQAGVAGNATRFDNKTMLALGGQDFEVVPIHQENLSAELSQLLDVTGQVAASVSQARLSAMATAYQLRATAAEQVLTTTTDYYAVLRASADVKVAQATLDDYREQLRTTTLLYKQGVGMKIDVDRASSQVADAERGLLEKQNELNAARSVLNDQIGRALDANTQLTESNSSATDMANFPDRPALIAQALGRRSEILGADLTVAAAQKGIKIAYADAEPLVTLGLSGNYYPTTSFQEPRHSVAALMINVSMPILDGGLARHRADEARAEVDSTKVQEEQVKRTVSLQVQTSALDVETARKRLDAANVSLLAAQEARKLAQQRYSAQVAQYLEVTDAQAALSAAEAAQVDATYDLLTAEARLSRATGELDSTEPITPADQAHMPAARK